MAGLATAVGDLMIAPYTSKIKLAFGAISLDANSYKAVKTAIDGGKITVQHDAKMGSRSGRYRYTHNTMFLGFPSITTQDQQALVVHESTHAAFDIAGKALKVSHSEAAAYIAQCLFFYYANEPALSTGNVKPTFASPILQAAWDAAMLARPTGTVTEKDLEKLLAAIAKDADYKDNHDQDEAYDGV
jgi:hypothetical protein